MCFTDLVICLGCEILQRPAGIIWNIWSRRRVFKLKMRMTHDAGKKLDKVRWQLWSVSAAQTRSREARTDVWRLRRLREEEKLYNYSGDYIPLLLRSRMGGDDAHSVLALPRSKEELNILYILFHCVWPLPLLRSAASCIIHKQTQQGSSFSGPSIILLHWFPT